MKKNGKVVGMDDNGTLWIFHGKAAQARSRTGRNGATPPVQPPQGEATYKQILNPRHMKRKFVPILIGVSAMALLAGCSIDLRFGGGSKTTGGSTTSNSTTSNSTANNNQHPTVVQQTAPTVGQQLLDLKKARDDGAISEQEYETEKARLLNQK